MPTTLPVDFSALPIFHRKASTLSGVSTELVIVGAWAMAMLATSLFALHRGLPIETFNYAF